jgi:hypothetical protein
MKLYFSLCLGLALLWFGIFDQGKNKPLSKKPKPTPTPAEARIAIETGIVYASGDVKPVAREKFYLLDADIGQVLFDAGLKPPVDARPAYTRNEQQQLVNSFAMAVLDSTTSMERLEFYQASKKLFPAHIIKSVETDFSGKASFESVTPGTYYLFGITKTRKAFAVWNYRVDAKAGETKITLDQHNANYAE